jgi:large subunit ribosomal protein L21
MFAVVRTGGKQYRVHPGDKIVVEKLDGNAGDKITLGEVLLAGDGGDLKKTDGLTVAAEIVAQAKGEKVTVFKKRRRHNYRRKKGHRQQHTILKIVAIGDHKEAKKPAPSKAEVAPKAEESPKAAAEKKPAARAKETAETTAAEHEALEVAGAPTENPAPNNAEAAGAEEPATRKAQAKKPAAKAASTKNAAPAKAAAKKSPKAK